MSDRNESERERERERRERETERDFITKKQSWYISSLR